MPPPAAVVASPRLPSGRSLGSEPGGCCSSSLPLLRDFGIIVSMNVVVALLSALIVLPPIMVWAENRGLVSKGMVDPSLLGNKERDEQTDSENLVPGSPDLSGAHNP